MFGVRRLSILLSATAVRALLVFCVACSHRPSVAPPRSVVAAPRSWLTALSTRDVELRQLQALTCNSGVPCCVHDILSAGTDVHGHRLSAVTVSEGRCVDDDGSHSGQDEDSVEGCDQYWLATDDQPEGPSIAWLGEECPNARLEVNTSVDDRAHTFTHSSHSLFSNDRTETTITIALAPLHLQSLSASSQSFSHSRVESWNFDEFAGELNFGVDYCAREAAFEREAVTDRDAPELEVSAVAIPRVALPLAFRDGGWRTTQLNRCGARVGGAKSGFTVAGGPARAGDLAFVALLSTENDLFVEIDDDRFSGNGADKLPDELQIWLAAPESCVDPSQASAVRKLAIRVADGRIVAGLSGAIRPVVEIEKVAHAARMRNSLGDLIGNGERLTVAYADARANRTIASSAFDPGKWWTLGQAFEVPADAQMPWAKLSCALHGNTLIPTPIMPFQR